MQKTIISNGSSIFPGSNSSFEEMSLRKSHQLK